MKKTECVVSCILLFLIFLIIIIFAATGCNVEKHTVKDRVVIDSSSIKSLMIKIEEQSLLIEHQKRSIEQLENLGVTFNDTKIDTAAIRRQFEGTNCPPSDIDKLLKDIASSKTTIRKMSDGTLEIIGNVKDLTQSNKVLMNEIIDMKRVINNKDSIIQVLSDTVKKDSSNKSKEVKKTSVIPPWLLDVLILALALFICYRVILYFHKLFFKSKN